MIALVQRVRYASVSVEGEVLGRIGPGVLALIGVQKDDTASRADRLLQRILGYRMFGDADGRMNLSLTDTAGGLLLVPQFTLAADTRKGARPSFSSAAPPDLGERLFDHLLQQARQMHPDVASGRFGADMQVELLNDGPVTFWLQS
jgi:D-aminoacyl-tRNA deacylase